MELPKEVGVMVLPNTILFPHNLLPLYIFEPRYRKMLKSCLASHRMFAVALDQNECGSCSPAGVAGVGLIRACVENPDGTSNLVLQGMFRVKFARFAQIEPIYIGVPEILPSDSEDSGEIRSLSAGIVAAVTRIHRSSRNREEGIEEFLRDIEDSEMLADIVAGSFVHDTKSRQKILETVCLRDRLQLIARRLQLEYPGTK
jgi:Lon protease-like protein